jgi:hypothetical protein
LILFYNGWWQAFLFDYALKTLEGRARSHSALRRGKVELPTYRAENSRRSEILSNLIVDSNVWFIVGSIFLSTDTRQDFEDGHRSQSLVTVRFKAELPIVPENFRCSDLEIVYFGL